MANSADPDFKSQLIWSYTVFKGRVYPGSAGLGLMYGKELEFLGPVNTIKVMVSPSVYLPTLLRAG